MRIAFACVGIVAMLAVSSCSRTEAGPSTPVASPSFTGEPTGLGPTASVEPSLPAGIPTASPSPRANQSPNGLNASPRITIATADQMSGDLIVGGYVSGVVEDGGDCEYVATSTSGHVVSVHTVGVENSSSTSCGSTSLDASLVARGSYEVVLFYTNEHGRVSSDPVEVTIP